MSAFFSSKALLAVLTASAALTASAQDPIITLHTNLYNIAGAENHFVVYMGMTSDDTVEIDGGYGPTTFNVSQAVYNPTTAAIDASQIVTTVSPEGVVTIYGDASKIDYIDFQGTYITSIEMSNLTNLEIINFDNDELQALDLTPFTKLQSVSLKGNPFDVSPLIIGTNKPDLAILNLNLTGQVESSFNISNYPNLMSFTAWNCQSLSQCDPSGCPNLLQLSIDGTAVSSLDVSNNPRLSILNISETRISDIDLSHNQALTQFYCSNTSGVTNTDVHLNSIDVSHNPELVYLFCGGNDFTSLDLSQNSKLITLSASYNKLSSIDLSGKPDLFDINISYNNMDFATLPINPGTWGDYIYTQNDMKVARSFPVDGSLDLSARVLRKGYNTYVQMARRSPENPAEITYLDGTYFTFTDGVVNFLKPVADSVFMQYSCDAFPDGFLNTTPFVVKTAAEYGKPVVVAQFQIESIPADGLSQLRLAVAGASEASPVTVYIDLGDGTLTPCSITTSSLPDQPNVKLPFSGYLCKIAVTDDAIITGFGYDGHLTKAIVSGLTALQTLDLSDCGLYTIDLSENSSLTHLNLSHNNLREVVLFDSRAWMNKRHLSYIDLSYNQLTAFEVPDNRVARYLDLSHNNIPELMMRDSDNLIHFNVAANSLESLNMSYAAGLQYLDASDNQLSTIVFAEGVAPDYINISGNKFTFANMPQLPAAAETVYAPQRDIAIPVIGPAVNLSNQYLRINGHLTEYAWAFEDGADAVEGVDYTVNEGVTRFLTTDKGKLIGRLTNAGLPLLTIYTTPIQPTQNPDRVLATFTTPVGGQNASLSLAGNYDGMGLYIDWSGNGDLDQYVLGTTYRLFEATTTGEAEVKVYTYSADDRLTVFSIDNVTMSSIDASQMTDLINFSVTNASLTNDGLILPENPALLELILEGNRLTDIDLSAYPNLVALSLTNNRLTSYDLSKHPQLQVAALAYNQLTALTFNNPRLWFLAVAQNNLESLDLSKARNLETLSVSHNRLSTLDVSRLSRLHNLYVDFNRFNFATLPPVLDTYAAYVYANQADINPTVTDGCRINLAYTATSASGSATEFYWYKGYPELDEEGYFVGDELTADTDFTIAAGVTTFLGSFDNVVGVLTNEAFPEMYLLTTAVNVVDAGVGNVAVDGAGYTVKALNSAITVNGPAGSRVALYTTTGQLVATAVIAADGEVTFSNLAPAVYLVNTPAGTFKTALR